MQILKLRVHNYKSIIDSGDCYLEQGITIFAGKNEAGKTALLEALEDFNAGSDIRPTAKHLHRKDKLPKIILTFKLDPTELQALAKKLGVEIVDPENEKQVTIIKDFPNKYLLPEDTFHTFFGTANDDNLVSVSEAIKELNTRLEKYPDLKKLAPESISAYAELLNQLGTIEPQLQASTELVDKEKQLVIGLVQKAKAGVTKLQSLSDVQAKLLEALKDLIPNFILFNSFEEKFPTEIPIEEIETTPIMKDLVSISGLDLAIIKNGQAYEKEEHKEQLNIRVKEDYQKFWSQDFTNLHFSWDSNVLSFHIKEDGAYYPPDIRSQGKRWHLAFYIRVTARTQDKKNNVLLIDEPGLFLHASAQRDILKKLAEVAEKRTVLFTTHSPYLLDPNEFERIRLVFRGKIPRTIESDQIDPTKISELTKFYTEKSHSKTKEKYYSIHVDPEKLEEEDLNKLRKSLATSSYNIGTIVEQKIHKVSDKETLRPILTAIGLELVSGVVNLDKEKNIVCEGQSDVYYLNGLKQLTDTSVLNFIFGGGGPNMPFVGTILHGWGCKVLYLYDNDSGFTESEKNLRKIWLIKEKVVKVADESGKSIEDLFSPDDFKKYVLEDEQATYTTSNSDYIKKIKKDKVLLGKTFLKNAKSGSVSLSDTTIQNFEKVRKEFESKFSELQY